jgi:putative heme-binding domain-containing protein
MKHEGEKLRFPQTFVIYEGGTLPERYHGNVIAANALHNKVWSSELFPDGSTFQTVDLPVMCETPDRWFRPVDVKVGPDGAVYIADWYDTRLTHVDPRDNWNKTVGRVYRIQNADHEPAHGRFDLTKFSDERLIALFDHDNKWWRQTSVRVLGERLLSQREDRSPETIAALQQLVRSSEPEALEALWTLHWAGLFDEPLARELLGHDDPDVRRWTVRLLGDQRRIGSETAAGLAELARGESYVQVRSQLASSAKRFETQYALPIIDALLTHDEDLEDPHLPLLIWWALEGHCGNETLNGSANVGVPLTPEEETSPREQILAFLENGEVWSRPLFESVIVTRIMRRFALEGETALDACEKLLALAPTDEHRRQLMAGFLEAYQGREIANLPEGLKRSIEAYQSSIGDSDLVLGVRLGQQEAVQEALKVVRDESADAPTRLALIETFGQVEQPSSVPVLLGLLSSSRSSGIKKAAMLALASYSDPKIGQTICSRYHSSLPDEHGLRETAQQVLASRPEWTMQFLKEVDQFRIRRDTVPLAIVQQMRLHEDPEIQELLAKHWGKTRSTPAEKEEQIARLRKLITASRSGREELKPDLAAGRALFKQHCAVCHTLFDEGGQTGPNLTGYERDNLGFLLQAIVDPSAAIREEFTQFQVATVDGRVVTGLIDDQNPNTVTLRTANNETTVIRRDDIEVLQAMDISIMPDGLTEKLSDREILDLFGYLMQPTPQPVAGAGE